MNESLNQPCPKNDKASAALKMLFESSYSQLEIDIALENAIAYSQIRVAEYLLSLGADFSNYDYQGEYYAAHNNELEGLKFAISMGVDINIRNGMLLNIGVETAMNTKSTELVEWLIRNGADTSHLTMKTIKLAMEYGNEELKAIIKNRQPK